MHIPLFFILLVRIFPPGFFPTATNIRAFGMGLLALTFIFLLFYYNTERINKNMEKYNYKKIYAFYTLLIIGLPFSVLILIFNT